MTALHSGSGHSEGDADSALLPVAGMRIYDLAPRKCAQPLSKRCPAEAMTSLFLQAVFALGHTSSASNVRDIVEQLGANERYDDPPFRHYLSASRIGVSLLFEEDRLIDVQVFVEATKTKASCTLDLPFGLQRGMDQSSLHAALGEPASSDALDSRYLLDSYGARLLAAYDQTGRLRYLSFAPIPKKN